MKEEMQNGLEMMREAICEAVWERLKEHTKPRHLPLSIPLPLPSLQPTQPTATTLPASTPTLSSSGTGSPATTIPQNGQANTPDVHVSTSFIVIIVLM